MRTHQKYTIRFTDHAAKYCQAMNILVKDGVSIAQASKQLGLSKSTGRRYYNGSYDVNPGYDKTGTKQSFTCMRLGAKVDI